MQTLKPDEIATAIRALINLYIRHSVIGQLENSRLENVIYKMAADLRENKSLESALKTMAEFAPPDEVVVSSFERLSLTHNGVRRYILRKLEETKRETEELAVNPASKVHVEHIYPQTPQAEHRWPNHNQFINRIGNLTLLSRRLNTTIRNKPFSEKKPYYEKSDLLLTKELLGQDDWNSNKVEERQKALAELAPIVWPIISEANSKEKQSASQPILDL